MKKIFLSLILLFSMSGCFKSDSMDDITIYTSVYPIEFVTDYLYGEHADELNSIYPDGIIVENYSLSEKQISDYSQADLFVYNGLDGEKQYAATMIENNENIKIIDASMAIEIDNSYEEMWLDPNNLLMVAQNIKGGLDNYVSNPYLVKEIDENYEELKIILSEMDAEIRLIVENADNNQIVVSKDTLKFLEKYGIEVISLEENDNLTDKAIADAARLIKEGKVQSIFISKLEEPSDTVNRVIDATGAKTVSFDFLSGISEITRDEKITFIDIMNDNIELLKNELYQ